MSRIKGGGQSSPVVIRTLHTPIGYITLTGNVWVGEKIAQGTCNILGDKLLGSFISSLTLEALHLKTSTGASESSAKVGRN